MARRHVPNQFDATRKVNNSPPRRINNAPVDNDPPGGLTPKFNAAAKHLGKKQSKSIPVSKRQLEVLKSKLSRTAHTHEMTPHGNVVGSYDPARDRRIRHNIKAIQKALSKRQDMARNAFKKAQLQNKAKQAFNRSSGIRM